METTKNKRELLFHVNPTISISPHTFISPYYSYRYIFQDLGCSIDNVRNVANVVVFSFISFKYCQIVQYTTHSLCSTEHCV